MRKRPTSVDKDNPAWTREDIRQAASAREVLPAAMLPRQRSQSDPQRAPARRSVSLRIDPDVLERFRATGDGWQTRINDALRRAAHRLR